MLLVASLTVTIISTGRATWYTGVLVLAVHSFISCRLRVATPK